MKILCKNNVLKREHSNSLLCFLTLMVATFTFSCKQISGGGEVNPTPSNEITITVQGDDGVNVVSANTFPVAKGSKWADIKTKAEEKATAKLNFAIINWHLKDKNGELLQNEKVFDENATVWASSERNRVKYKVEHWKEKAERPEFELDQITGTEIKVGAAGEQTVAEAKEYEGFEALGFTQQEIQRDGSTVVQIKYKRKIISLILDLDGGTTEPALEDGEGGKKLLKGKFGSTVTVKGLEKENFGFEKWEPSLPKLFPLTSPNTVYTAKWSNDVVSLTVKGGDDNIIIEEPAIVKVAKNAKWGDVKTKVMPKARAKENFRPNNNAWKYEDSSNQKRFLPDTYVFAGDTNVFAYSIEIEAKYTVEHWLENIENEKFQKLNTERLTGKAGQNTKASALSYKGFEAQSFEQKVIKADDTTLVKIMYKRKIISITFDLAGGQTTTTLENGADGKKILKGKFNSEIKIDAPTKQDFEFLGWKPVLPSTFPASDFGVCVARWGDKASYRVDILGDERVEVLDGGFVTVAIGSNKTFADIKDEVKDKVRLKAEWKAEDYDFYDWRIDGEKGEEMQETTQITKNIVVYARTNYKRFKIADNVLEGYESEAPKGRIILPKEIETIKESSFAKCQELTGLDLSSCAKLKKIEKNAFAYCTKLKTLDLTDCTELKSIEGSLEAGHPPKFEGAFFNCSSLVSVDLSSCTNLETIGEIAFSQCSNLRTLNLSGCSKLTSIEKLAFSRCMRLENVNLSSCNNLKTLGNSVFSECVNLKTVNLDSCTGLESIGYGVFNNCQNLESINLSPCTNLKTITDSAFSKCNNLKTVNLSGCVSLETIKGGSHSGAFSGCTSLEGVDLSTCTKLKKIEKNTFLNCKKALVKLPTSIMTVEEKAFGVNNATYCKKVLVPTDEIKQLVVGSKYPEERIEKY